jgi:tetratricopeptide (TPR) repeat protein
MSVDEDLYTEYDWFGEGKVLEAKGEFEKALKAYGEAIKLNPEFAKAWFYKAKLHAQLGQMDEALRCAKETMKLNPSWEKHIRKFLPDAEL